MWFGICVRGFMSMDDSEIYFLRIFLDFHGRFSSTEWSLI